MYCLVTMKVVEGSKPPIRASRICKAGDQLGHHKLFIRDKGIEGVTLRDAVATRH